ncbi:MAG TPA: hypothetical protein VK357_11865 [Rubrobacteraceae bacterium]|nr:hypothetical protein [Rubrobacteraceae bacterium]
MAKDRRKWGLSMAESQVSELQNMRVLLEEARLLARNLAYHRRATLESSIGQTLDKIERQVEDLPADRGQWWGVSFRLLRSKLVKAWIEMLW